MHKNLYNTDRKKTKTHNRYPEWKSARSGLNKHISSSNNELFSLSFFFFGVQRILEYVRPRRTVAVHPPKRGKRRSIWRSLRIRTAFTQHCDIVGLQMVLRRMQILNWDTANVWLKGINICPVDGLSWSPQHSCRRETDWQTYVYSKGSQQYYGKDSHRQKCWMMGSFL